jgi:hypothetical protein
MKEGNDPDSPFLHPLKLFILVNHLISAEIRVLLVSDPSAPTLNSYISYLECIMKLDFSSIPSDSLLSLLKALKETVICILDFLIDKSHEEKGPGEDLDTTALLLSCLEFLSSWFCEMGAEGIELEVIGSMPSLISYCKEKAM